MEASSSQPGPSGRKTYPIKKRISCKDAIKYINNWLEDKGELSSDSEEYELTSSSEEEVVDDVVGNTTTVTDHAAVADDGHLPAAVDSPSSDTELFNPSLAKHQPIN